MPVQWLQASIGPAKAWLDRPGGLLLLRGVESSWCRRVPPSIRVQFPLTSNSSPALGRGEPTIYFLEWSPELLRDRNSRQAGRLVPTKQAVD